MKFKDLFTIIKEHEIIRRYMIINSFDGALTILGIVFASFVVGIRNPSLIILPGIGATIAMCISGMWGAYAAESAEVKKAVKELEMHLLVKLRTTKRYLESKKITFLVGLIDGFSPLVTALIILVPFFLASRGVISIMHAYYSSMAITGVLMLLLGVVLGKIAKENIFFNAFKMLLAGVAIAVVFYLLALSGLI